MLKVYAWLGSNEFGQTREIIAAHSWKEVYEATPDHFTKNFFRTWGSRTWNDEEVAAATAQPGVVLWRGLDDIHAPFQSEEPTE